MLKEIKLIFAFYVHAGRVNIYSPGGLLLGQVGAKYLVKEDLL